MTMSIGIPGQWDHPHVIDMGVWHFCIGGDAGILFDWFKSNGAKLRAMVGI